MGCTWYSYRPYLHKSTPVSHIPATEIRGGVQKVGCRLLDVRVAVTRPVIPSVSEARALLQQAGCFETTLTELRWFGNDRLGTIGRPKRRKRRGSANSVCFTQLIQPCYKVNEFV